MPLEPGPPVMKRNVPWLRCSFARAGRTSRRPSARSARRRAGRVGRSRFRHVVSAAGHDRSSYGRSAGPRANAAAAVARTAIATRGHACRASGTCSPAGWTARIAARCRRSMLSTSDQTIAAATTHAAAAGAARTAAVRPLARSVIVRRTTTATSDATSATARLATVIRGRRRVASTRTSSQVRRSSGTPTLANSTSPPEVSTAPTRASRPSVTRTRVIHRHVSQPTIASVTTNVMPMASPRRPISAMSSLDARSGSRSRDRSEIVRIEATTSPAARMTSSASPRRTAVALQETGSGSIGTGATPNAAGNAVAPGSGAAAGGSVSPDSRRGVGPSAGPSRPPAPSMASAVSDRSRVRRPSRSPCGARR